MAITSKTQNVLFLEVAAGGGHLSITDAILESLNDINPQINPIRLDFNSSQLGKGYESLVRQYPQLYNLVFKATDNPHTKNLISNSSRLFTTKYLFKAIQIYKPKVIISNTLFTITEIPQILKKLHKIIPFLVFVPDPFTPHSVFYQPHVDLTMVSSLTAYQRGLKAGISPNKLVITGHPIRKKFFSKVNQTKIRKKLKLNISMPTFVLGGSGGGIEKTEQILHFLSNLKLPPCQIIILSGNHNQLVQYLKQQIFPKNMHLTILPKIKNVSDYLHASDFVVAKAGPNILLESLAAGKPFIVAHHIHGQENGNVDFIRSTQSGFVEENPEEAAKLISNILHNPQILDQTKPGVEFVRNQHKPAAQTIAKYINRYL
jgi:UDP-N-acetylglucosamine:LPS N-acetylglucosamine transferase